MFNPDEHVQYVFNIIQSYSESCATLGQIAAQVQRLSGKQLFQVMNRAVELGYGEWHSRPAMRNNRVYSYHTFFVCYGATVPWTGEVVNCSPKIDWTTDAAQPTDLRAGSPEKIELLKKRLEQGLPLHIQGDADFIDEGFSNSVWT